MGLSQIAEFKQFLFDNFSNVGAIALITTLCVIVLSLAMREMLSWFTKTDKIRNEVHSLRKEIKFLQGDIKLLTDRLSAVQTNTVETKLAEKEEAPEPKKTSSFPLNH